MVVRKCRIGGRRKGPRVALVTGIHGDELEGQFVSFELARRLKERPFDVRGTVDIYPALNPMGLSANTHGMPSFDIDLDHSFPGNARGDLSQALAAAVLDDVCGARACVIVHSSVPLMREAVQARIEAESDELVRLASLLNVHLVWKRPTTPESASTLAHALNERGVPAIIVEMGSGMRVSERMGIALVEGVLRLLADLGVWSGPTVTMTDPTVTDGSNVHKLVAERSGLFLPRVAHESRVSRGQTIGIVADPLAGETVEEVPSPCDGLLFSLRAYPMVYPGAPVARILEDTP